MTPPYLREEAAEVGCGVDASEAVGAEHGGVQRDEGSDRCGVGAGVVGGDDGRALAAFELLGDVGLARGLGFGVEAVVALGVLAVAGELVEAGAGPDVPRYPEILVEPFGRGDDLPQDRARAPQLTGGLPGLLFRSRPIPLAGFPPFPSP